MILTDGNYLNFVRFFENINYICTCIIILTTAYYMTIVFSTPNPHIHEKRQHYSSI